MRYLYKNEYPSVDASDPWAADQLDRKKIADLLTPIVTSTAQPFVIALDSPYGTGKSLFMDCWKAHLSAAGHRTIKFNAWESDFSQNALAALMSSLKRDLPAPKTSKAKKNLVAAGKQIMSATARKLPGIIVKSAVKKALGESGADEAMEMISLTSDDVADIGQKAVDATLEAQGKAEASLATFRASLAEIVAGIEAPEDSSAKLILLVDELDRCRPTYAIEILECLKHLFQVPGIVFVLGVDWDFLRAAVSGVYGPRIDPDAYLMKFIDWRYKLPIPSPVQFANHLAKKFSVYDLLATHKGVQN